MTSCTAYEINAVNYVPFSIPWPGLGVICTASPNLKFLNLKLNLKFDHRRNKPKLIRDFVANRSPRLMKIINKHWAIACPIAIIHYKSTVLALTLGIWKIPRIPGARCCSWPVNRWVSASALVNLSCTVCTVRPHPLHARTASITF